MSGAEDVPISAPTEATGSDAPAAPIVVTETVKIERQWRCSVTGGLFVSPRCGSFGGVHRPVTITTTTRIVESVPSTTEQQQ